MKKIKYVRWREKIRVDRFFGISDFKSFAEDLNVILEFPKEQSKYLLFIHRNMQAGDSKEFEVVFDGGEMKARYALFALSKRGDKTDVICTLYALDAVQAPGQDKSTTQKAVHEASFFDKLFRRNRPSIDDSAAIALGGVALEDDKLKSYFRHKAVNGFSGEGLVERAKLKYI